MTLIKREDAIKTWNKLSKRGRTEFDQVLTTLPSAEAETKCVAQINVNTEEIVRRIKEEYDITDEWIPCSERLPSNSGNYLITVADFRLGHIMEYTVTIADLYVNGERKKWNSVADVLAWMPLPKPYREDGEAE